MRNPAPRHLSLPLGLAAVCNLLPEPWSEDKACRDMACRISSARQPNDARGAQCGVDMENQGVSPSQKLLSAQGQQFGSRRSCKMVSRLEVESEEMCNHHLLKKVYDSIDSQSMCMSVRITSRLSAVEECIVGVCLLPGHTADVGSFVGPRFCPFPSASGRTP